jgi:hypothetical protein
VSIHKLEILIKIKACEKNNRRHISNIPRIYPPKFGGGLFFEHNPREIGSAFHRAVAETCPLQADWAKKPFMDRH